LRHALILVPAAIVALFAALALVARGGGPGSGCGSFRFSPVAWSQGSNAAQTGRTSARWRTAEHLAECDTLSGRTRASVRGLLGPPGATAARVWLYPVGYELGDLRYLEVRFGGDGRVRGVASP
jgi:hypothetical protein